MPRSILHRSSVLAFACSAALSAHAADVEAIAIPAGELKTAIELLIKQSGVELMYSPDQLQGIRTAGVTGSMSLEQAVTALLQGTPLTLRTDEASGALLITAKPAFTLEQTSAAKEAGTHRGANNLTQVEAASVAPADADVQRGQEHLRALEESPDIMTVAVYGRGLQTDSVRDVPRSVTVLGREALEAIGTGPSATLTDAFRFLPSASNLIGDYAFGSNFSIRGASPPTYSWNGMIRLSYMSKVSLANVERVEALMGPASVTYGAMQPGGVINVVTKQPTAELHSQIGLQGGSWGTYGAAVDVAGPLSEGIRARLNVSYDHLGAPFDHWSRNTAFIAPVVEFDLTDRTLLTLEAFHQEVDYPEGIFDGRVPAVGSLLPNPNGAQIPERLNTAHFSDLTRFNLKATDLSLRLRHELSDALTVSAQGYYYQQRMGGIDGFIDGALAADNTIARSLYPRDEKEHSYGATVGLAGKFHTGDVAHQLSAGIDYLIYDYLWASGDYLATPPIVPLSALDPDYRFSGSLEFTPTLRYESRSRAAAAYLQERATFAERLSLVIGARYTDSLDEASMSFQADGSRETFPDTVAAKWSTQLGALYHFTDTLTLWTGRNTSYVPRGPIQLRDGSIYSEPETATQYELGLRMELLDSNAMANLTVFRTIRPNALTNDPVDPFFSIPNGELTSKGVEASMSGRILPGWTAFFAYAYNPTEVSKSNIPGQQGMALQNAPKHSASLITRYDTDHASLRGLGVSLAVNYLGDKYADVENALVLPSSQRVDLGLHYRVNDGLELGLQANNLTDEEIYSGFSRVMVMRNAGRNYMFNVKILPAKLR